MVTLGRVICSMMYWERIKMKKKFLKAICGFMCVCLLLPVQAQAASGTARVPNDAIDISTTKLAYNLRNVKNSTIYPDNNTIKYTGSDIQISAYPEIDNCVLPRESYSLSIEGSNVKKTLVKEGYTEQKNIYNDRAYGFQDTMDDNTILACSLLPVYQTGKRLGFKSQHVWPFYWTFMDITDEYTLDELRQYSSMTDFVNKTGYMQSDDIMEDVSPGYITEFENTMLDKAKQWGFNDIDSYISYLCEENEYASCAAVEETRYPIYYIVSKNLVSLEQVESIVEEHNYGLFEKEDSYYLYGGYSRTYADYMDYNTRVNAPKIANELNLNSDQVEYSYEPETIEVYHTYYNFTCRQLINAIATEMDTWSGRWDYFLYGDEHFNYWYESEDVREPGYYFGNYGYGFGAIQDQITVNYEPQYKYTITGPGRVTITITGREDQNGHGSVNLKGTGTIYLDVLSDTDSIVPVGNNKTGILQATNGEWYYFRNGKVDTACNDVLNNKNGWWVVRNGKVDFGFNGIASNSYGSWYCTGGKVNFNTNGVMHSAVEKFNGWYYIKGGRVQTGCETVQHNSNGWWYIGTDGKVNFSINTVAKNQYGWWFIRNGKVDFSINTVAKNQYGWWVIRKGKVDFGFKGIASNSYGSWYCKGGKVDFSYSGEYRASNGIVYKIKNGKVVA